jgi:hypothetical protein
MLTSGVADEVRDWGAGKERLLARVTDEAWARGETVFERHELRSRSVT